MLLFIKGKLTIGKVIALVIHVRFITMYIDRRVLYVLCCQFLWCFKLRQCRTHLVLSHILGTHFDVGFPLIFVFSFRDNECWENTSSLTIKNSTANLEIIVLYLKSYRYQLVVDCRKCSFTWQHVKYVFSAWTANTGHYFAIRTFQFRRKTTWYQMWG
jgi:hypothetical protein